MTYLIGKSGYDSELPSFGALFPTPQPRYITDGDIAALIPADVKRTGKHKADKLPWRVERYVQPPMTMMTSAMDEDVEFDANGNVVRTTWNIYLGKHKVRHCNNLAGVKTYFQHADKREVYDEFKLQKKLARQRWADRWDDYDYDRTSPKHALQEFLADAPDDFDTTVLSEALASIEEAIRAYHAAQR